MTRRVTIWTALFTAALAATALGDDAAPPAQASAPASALGDVFESRVAGISLRPPAGGNRIRQTDSGYLVQFSYPDKSWDLRVKVTELSKSVPLSQDASGDNPGGMLQMTAAQTGSAVEVQSAVVNSDLWLKPIGLILSHSNVGVSRVLTQTAILPGLDPETFYLLQFTSPGKAKTDPPGADPREAAAEAAFDRTLATVQVLDRAVLKREQNDRLMHSHEWMLGLDEKRISAVLDPDAYMRIVRDGKDVGFVHVVEQAETREGHDGVEVMSRSHLVADRTADASTAVAAPAQPASIGQLVPSSVVGANTADVDTVFTIDRLAKMFVSFDLRHEEWSITTNTGGGPLGMVTTSELGNSDKELHRVLDRKADSPEAPADARDKHEPHIRSQDEYHLSVSNYARARSGQPVERDLPPFYLPEAITQLLPRLLPLDEPRDYMFASYVGEQREVMARYIDVLPEQNVVLNDQRIVAIPVRDRIGIDGSATTHYMSKDGRWLGSVNPEQKLMVLPSDRDALEPIWKNALPPLGSAGR